MSRARARLRHTGERANRARRKGGKNEVHAAAGLRRSRRERGELVEAQALTTPELAKFVVSDGAAATVVTDGPFPESKELLAGYRMIDVESAERAIEIAAKGSAAPGPGGVPIKQSIEVREVIYPGGRSLSRAARIVR